MRVMAQQEVDDDTGEVTGACFTVVDFDGDRFEVDLPGPESDDDVVAIVSTTSTAGGDEVNVALTGEALRSVVEAMGQIALFHSQRILRKAVVTPVPETPGE